MKGLLILAVTFCLLALAFSQSCPCPTEDELIGKFNEVSQTKNMSDCDGRMCMLEYDDLDHDDHDHGHHHRRRNEGHHHKNCFNCSTMYELCHDIILGLGLTTQECLSDRFRNGTEGSSKPTTAQAYGYGFLMICLVCLCALIGIFLVPVIRNKSQGGRLLFEYTYAFIFAIGVSALLSDAVLHLIPHALGLHSHGHHEEDDDHDHDHDHHSDEEESEEHAYLWKASLVLLGIYAFYLIEVAMHGLSHYLTKKSKSGEPPHATNHAAPVEDGNYSAEMKETKEDKEDKPAQDQPIVDMKKPFFSRIEPVAWLVTVGGALHNFANGLALGSTVVQSLTLGLSIMFALVFHEITHELGDYVILIKSGLKWSSALFFNFISSLFAILGFFIGVAISSNSEDASTYILAITAGLFLYISLTDLLPDLVHGGTYKLSKSGWQFAMRFLLVNLGFFISYALLLVLARYEEDLDELIN
ncbi:PREDICTED: zinc transporter ZIP10-like isoform X1 [Amphimedon queenslandica]|uniref:Zinc transporter ZIP4 N-terminal domain-containing protein n=1 Tax=Amphimedon queenslandica TaxID=400682 RepID=A0AAN0JCB4_AMPQE|nr:PREDICTED: zinc transporter ZIP10-like isoform X1 [Amphimedon queenslandica]|eukprot:XP_019854660.1 PREDICTED: zinc transporter ZIP10-like isoform X1 [Amphimedon queenslandica]